MKEFLQILKSPPKMSSLSSQLNLSVSTSPSEKVESSKVQRFITLSPFFIKNSITCFLQSPLTKQINQTMRSFSQKRNNDRLFSQIAESIGTQIRNSIIESKKPSPQKQFSIRTIIKIKTEQFNPEQDNKNFWLNPYKSQKQKWNHSFPNKPFFSPKQDVQNYKKYELEKFKQKLKTSLEENQSMKQHQTKLNKSRVRTFRQQLSMSRDQKTSSMLYNKQLDAQLLRREIYRKKTQARMHKRRIELDMKFDRWHRQEEKLLKHKIKLSNLERLKTAS